MLTVIFILIILLLVALVTLLVTTGLTILYYAVPALLILGCISIAIRMIKGWFKSDKKGGDQ